MTREEMEVAYARDLSNALKEGNARMRALRELLAKSLERETALASALAKLQRQIASDNLKLAPGDVEQPSYVTDGDGNWRKRS